MRIREENCNMILLAAVAGVSVIVAGGASLFGPGQAVRVADGSAERIEQSAVVQPAAANVGDPSPVRVIGAPFVPNTNPRER
jgi:hypothetical protein